MGRRDGTEEGKRCIPAQSKIPDFILTQKEWLCYNDGKNLDYEIEKCWCYVLYTLSKRISILS